ncbi:MAG: hypothetical protein OXF88_10495 [Rhodobacteraceae bacterium]|nr:hypothetical protein [Paracoccaceae bacterium]
MYGLDCVAAAIQIGQWWLVALEAKDIEIQFATEMDIPGRHDSVFTQRIYQVEYLTISESRRPYYVVGRHSFRLPGI